MDQQPQHHALQAFLIAAVVAPFSYYAGAAAQRLHLPRISGYLISGVALGPFALGVLSSSSVADLSVVEGACLAVIGVAAGAELHWGELARARRAVVALTLAICAATWLGCFFAVVAAATARPSVLWLSRAAAASGGAGPSSSSATDIIANANLDSLTTLPSDALKAQMAAPPPQPLSAPLLPYASLAATLAMARSPASAIAVLRELDAKGTFSSMVMGVTVLKDVIVIVAFAINVQFVSMAAKAKAAAAAVAAATAGTAAAAAARGGATTTTATITASAARLFLLPLLSVAVSVSIGVVGGMVLSIAMSRPVAVRLAAAAARAAAVAAGTASALAALFGALMAALSARLGGGGGGGGGLGGISTNLDRAGSLGGPPPLPLVGGVGVGDGAAATLTAAAATNQHLARCKEASLLLLSTAVFTITRALDAEPLLACVTMGLVAGNRAFTQLILGPGARGGGAGGVDAASSSSAAAAAAALAKAPSGGVVPKARLTDGGDGEDDGAVAQADGANNNDGDDDDDGDHGHPHHADGGADGSTAASAADPNNNDLSSTANAVMAVTNVAFFGLAGASLRLPAVVQSAWLAGALVAARLGAIRLGCAFGSSLGGVKLPEHRRLFWRAMVTQAGVALGLARIAGTAFSGWGPHFQTAMTAVVMANLAVGPPLFRSALIGVGEAGGGGGWGGGGGRGGRRTGGVGGSVPLIPLGGGGGGGGKSGGGAGGVDGGARRR